MGGEGKRKGEGELGGGEEERKGKDGKGRGGNRGTSATSNFLGPGLPTLKLVVNVVGEL